MAISVWNAIISKVSGRSFTIALALVLSLVMLREGFLLFLVAPHFGDDFDAYYTAACLVRSGHSLDVYEAAKKEVDAAENLPAPESAVAHAAHAHGIFFAQYYDYPPTLADILVPLTFVSSAAAFKIWCGLNFVALLVAGVLLVRMPEVNLTGCAVPVLVFLIIFPPCVSCLTLGQIPIALLFIVVAGISLYAQGKHAGAALLFALAAAIKLTPLVVIVPLLASRDWKALRALALWCAAILAALVAINGLPALSLYFLQGLPLMGGHTVDMENRSVGTAIQVLWSRFGAAAWPSGGVWAGRLFLGLILCYAGWLSRWSREDIDKGARVETIAIFLLLSCCVAPVSWWHAYVLAAPALVIWAKRTWDKRSNLAETIVLGLFLLMLSTCQHLGQGLLTPLLGILLGIMALHRLARERFLERPERFSGAIQS